MVAEDIDIELGGFSFPTDRITIKDLRRMFPGRIDNRKPDDPADVSSIYDRLAELFLNERSLAINTYDQTRENYREFGIYGEDLEFVGEELAKMYIKYGIASGPSHAELLIRSIETQAREQAERHGGKAR